MNCVTPPLLTHHGPRPPNAAGSLAPLAPGPSVRRSGEELKEELRRDGLITSRSLSNSNSFELPPGQAPAAADAPSGDKAEPSNAAGDAAARDKAATDPRLTTTRTGGVYDLEVTLTSGSMDIADAGALEDAQVRLTAWAHPLHQVRGLGAM